MNTGRVNTYSFTHYVLFNPQTQYINLSPVTYTTLAYWTCM